LQKTSLLLLLLPLLALQPNLLLTPNFFAQQLQHEVCNFTPQFAAKFPADFTLLSSWCGRRS
jgi:hypothetical protein